MKYRILFIFVVLYGCLTFAQSELKFHTLSPKGGLSYDGILDIKQDGNGLMWMLLENNLFRFDGYTYKSYKSNFLNDADTSTVYFKNIVTDSGGELYVSTNLGLYKFEQNIDHFIKVINAPVAFTFTYIDNNETVWISSSNGLAFIGDNNELIYPTFKNRKLLLNRKVFCENERDLFVFSNYGQIYRYDRTDSLIVEYMNITTEYDGAYLIDAKIDNNEMWVLTSNFALFRIDLLTGQINYQYDGNILKDNGVRCLYISQDDDLWIGTMNGLYIHDPQSNQTRLYQHNYNEVFSIPHNSVWTIYEDKQNNIWLGTYMGSVAYINPYDKKIFETYGLSPNGLHKVPVSGFSENKNSIWISTEGGGVNVFNKDNRSFSYFQQSEKINSLSSNYTKASVVDASGNIWISTFRGGLNSYNPFTDKFTYYTHDSNDESSLLFNDLRKIVLEPDSGLWIAYLKHTRTISFFSFKDKIFTHYSLEESDNMIMPNDYIYDIYRGQDNKVWFIMSYSLYAFDIQSKQFTKYRIPSKNKAVASTLCVNDMGEVWIGTFGNEIIKFDPKSEVFLSFPITLQSDFVEIYSINHSDDKIWLGANDGLYLFDTKTNHTAVFKESDGTQGNVYYPLATMKGHNGLLYFGGAGGFTIVNQQNVSFNPLSPKALITDFYIDNKSVLGKSDIKIKTDFISKSSDLVLNYKQQNFGFTISSTNFLNTDKNQFKYRLRKFDDRWILADASSRTIQYSKIPAGTYFFEFQTANNDGIWGEISSVKIVRRQTPWLSTAAIIFYILMLSSLLIYLFSLYANRRRLQLELYKVRMEKEKRKEIHRSQLKFFTNISHDLKTPLSLIMATVNRMREEGMKEYYYNILNSNSQRLMRLLNDILDYRKVQNNMLKLEISNDNINQFVRTISSDFTETASEKGINYQIDMDDENLSDVPFDKKIIEKIVLNLLTNSFSYTPKGGTVRISLETKDFKSKYTTSHTIGDNSKFHDGSTFQLIVSDSGVGISKESISKVFDRFYRVEDKNDSTHIGTGIGLALVKELVLYQKGTVTIYSERNAGTDIVVRLSLLLDYYEGEELQKIVGISSNKDLHSVPSFTQPVNENINIIDDEINLSDKKDRDKTILIAEDNVDLRNIIQLSLEEEYKVVGFDDGKAALEYLEDEDVDLIISDIMMPEVDGITFCITIKKNVETSHIPFILLTAKSGLESMLEGTESGADLYFEKPLDLSLLKASLKNIFKQQDVLREHYAKNHFADISEITTNKEDCRFLTDLGDIIYQHIDEPELDVNTIASEMMMSRSKLYSKIKALTGKSIVEFILTLRLRKSAKLLIEKDISIQEAMFTVGIESRSYFSKVFKNEFGLPPSKFVKEYKDKQKNQ